MLRTNASDGSKKSLGFYTVGALAASAFSYLLLRSHKKKAGKDIQPVTTSKNKKLVSTPQRSIDNTLQHNEDKKSITNKTPILQEEIPEIPIHRKTTVYVWPRAKDSPTGHAAIKTYVGGKNGDGIYASFWPPDTCNKTYDEKKRPGTQNVCNNAQSHLHTYNQDRELYRPWLLQRGLKRFEADLSLDAEAINKAFIDFENSNFKWTRSGSSIFRRKNSRNCSGLCYYLLQKGGAEMLEYPITDYFGHMNSVANFINTAKSPQLQKYPTKTKIACGLANAGKANRFARINAMDWADTIWNSSNIVTFVSMGHLISYSVAAKNTKNGSPERLMNIGHAIGSSAILLHCLGYIKTILPTDIATIASYNQRLRNKKYEKVKFQRFLRDKIWPYQEHGILSRQSLNFGLAAIHGGADSYVAYYSTYQQASRYRLVKSFGVGAGSTLSTILVLLEPRILFSSLMGTMPLFLDTESLISKLQPLIEKDSGHLSFSWHAFKEVQIECNRFIQKEMNTLYDLSDVNKSNKTFGFAIFAFLIFLASDLLIAHIEYAQRKNKKNTIKPHQKTKPGLFNQATAALKRPRLWIRGAAFTSVACLGYFSARQLIKESTVTIPVPTLVKSPAT